MGFKFEKLIVWQKAVDLSYEISELTKKFPKEELFILTSQIKRAADSIALNIAEGSTGQSNLEFKRFLSYALRLSVEVASCLHLAERRNLITTEERQTLSKKCEEILVMINSLKRTLK